MFPDIYIYIKVKLDICSRIYIYIKVKLDILCSSYWLLTGVDIYIYIKVKLDICSRNMRMLPFTNIKNSINFKQNVSKFVIVSKFNIHTAHLKCFCSNRCPLNEYKTLTADIHPHKIKAICPYGDYHIRWNKDENKYSTNFSFYYDSISHWYVITGAAAFTLREINKYFKNCTCGGQRCHWEFTVHIYV